MNKYEQYIIQQDAPLSIALKRMNELSGDLTLFIIDEDNKLIGSLTDGDARRGLLNGLSVDDNICSFMNHSCFTISSNGNNMQDIIAAKKKNIRIIPLIDEQNHIQRLINFSFYYSYLPVDAFILAGGEGIRLRPLTANTPKPMLAVGDKPILEHLIDRLIRFGIYNIQLSVNYLGDKISDYFKDGADKGVQIDYVREKKQMGTIGSISSAKPFQNDDVLIINSDLLTNINFEEFYIDFIEKDADMSIACVPYSINIPYAILDITDDHVKGLKEKPTFEFLSNAGIYLIKKKHLQRIPADAFYNATDLIKEMIAGGLKITHFTLLNYWLDIGKMDDYHRAQRDIQYIQF